MNRPRCSSQRTLAHSTAAVLLTFLLAGCAHTVYKSLPTNFSLGSIDLEQAAAKSKFRFTCPDRVIGLNVRVRHDPTDHPTKPTLSTKLCEELGLYVSITVEGTGSVVLAEYISAMDSDSLASTNWDSPDESLSIAFPRLKQLLKRGETYIVEIETVTPVKLHDDARPELLLIEFTECPIPK